MKRGGSQASVCQSMEVTQRNNLEREFQYRYWPAGSQARATQDRLLVS